MQKISFCERYMLTTAVIKRLKTNTRRLEKALERAVEEYEQLFGMPFSVSSQKWDAKKKCISIWTPKSHIELKTRYKLGEVVAVAQSYKSVFEESLNYAIPRYHWLDDHIDEKGFENKMFVKASEMPHQIQITDVKIERLQDIGEEDCLKEGVICETFDDGAPLCYKVLGIYDKPKSLLLKEFMTPREAFAALIDRPGVGCKGLWESNPFVVVYQFKLVK